MKYLLFISVGFLCACTPIRQSEQPNKLTVGVVQKEICIGMPASDVAAVLGSPNIVSLDENKNEVWLYDKTSTQVEYCCQNEGVWLLLIGSGHQSGYAKRSQKTLTIVIKLDANKQVKDFTYHASSF